MKRILLLGASIGMAMGSFAQTALSYGTTIGNTYYDLHSNRSTGNRLVRTSDGDLSATWIEHWDFLTTDNEPKPGVRGFGYNHYSAATNGWDHGMEGECWEESFGCASQYVGWPEMINLESTNGNGNLEAIINHTPLKMTERADIGTGAWENTSELSIEEDMGDGDWDGTWPRAVVSGEYIHLIATSTDQGGFWDGTGVEMPCVYFRSDDGGATWSSPMAFDVMGPVVNEVITPTITYDSIGVDYVPTFDTSWWDTITNGSFTLGGTTFDADSYFMEDTVFLSLSGNPDTAVFVYSDTLTSTDTIATRLWFVVDSVATTLYDTIIGADTTYQNDTVNLVTTVGADAYAITANGANVAVTFGGGLDNDWVVFESGDNGTSWDRTWIRDNHNLPAIDVSAAGDPIVFTNNSVFDIMIDDAGKTHVFAGMSMVDGQFIYNDPQFYKDSDGGILYWSNGMTDAVTVGTPDYTEDGDDSNYGITGGEFYGFFFAGWPAASYDADGNIYLIYSAVQEGTEYINPTTGDTVGYNELYMVYSLDNGATWCGKDDPINIADDVYGVSGGTPIEDDIYPVSVPKIESDGLMHFTWQADYSTPGLALYEDTHPNDVLNYINYGRMVFQD